MVKHEFEKVAVIGLGLIGSSLCRALQSRNETRVVVGYDSAIQVRCRAVELKLADEVVSDAAKAVDGADLVILATPVGVMAETTREIVGQLKVGSILTDTGSVKGSVLRDLTPLVPPEVHFIPAHPVAGTEYSGPDAGFAELFLDRWCILTPTDDIDGVALNKLSSFWESIGCKIEVMDAHRHDLVLAVTSHLPHLIAYNIVGLADDLETVTESEVIKYSAGGFRDFTRIAASDPVMWRDVFLNNKDAVLEILTRFIEDLTVLQRAIRWDEGELLEQSFRRTRTIRHNIVDAGQAEFEDDKLRRLSIKNQAQD